MVSKKFRCAAPASHSWEERAANLLYALDGDVKKREELVEQTLEALKDHVEEKKRVGPGRKSHAENALAFYRYTLGLRQDNSIVPKRKKPKSTSDDDGQDGGDTANEEEFLAQHNDLCEVCNEGGELLCCSTCNLVFHVSCHKPEIKSEPPDDWSCAYCVSSGVTGHKREARIRKRAQQCVRDMTRRKEELEASKSSATCMKLPQGNTDQLTKENDTEKKLSVAADKDETQASTKDDDDAEGRSSRRTRKAPILYEPQAGADSKWKTDGHREWGAMSRSERKLQKSPKGKDGSTKNEDNGDEVWCNFCKDDPRVLLCCFCACRVCFGKHDGAKLLICDNCDSEYHTYCLTPPLSSVPKKRKWFCPSCAPKKKDKAESPRKARAASSLKKSPAPSTPKRSSTDAEKRSSSRSRTKPARFNSPTNIPKSSPSKQLSPQKPGLAPPKKRGPGRPRKHPLPEDRVLPVPKKTKTESKSGETRLKRSSSRESKADSKHDSSRYRERSSPAVSSLGNSLNDAVGRSSSNAYIGEKAPQFPVAPTQRSQSGRAVKRKTFHDEIPEGDQLLKSTPSSSRNTMGLQSKKVSVNTVPSGSLKPSQSQPRQAGQAALFGEFSGSTKGQLAVTLPIPKPVPPPGRVGLTPANTPTASNAQTRKLAAASGRSVAVSTPQSSTRATTQAASYNVAATSSSFYQNIDNRAPRRKPGARECMQISRRFGVQVIPAKYMEILLDYCSRGKVEHLIRMRERLDDHSRFLEAQLAGLESLVKENGETDVVVPSGVTEGDGNDLSSSIPPN